MQERFCPRQSHVTEGGVAHLLTPSQHSCAGVLVGIRSGVGDLPKYHPVALAKEERVPSLPVCSLLFRCLKHLVLDVERYILCSQNMPVTFSLRLTTAAKAMYQLGLRKQKQKQCLQPCPGALALPSLQSHPLTGLTIPQVRQTQSLDLLTCSIPVGGREHSRLPSLVLGSNVADRRKGQPLSLVLFLQGRGRGT